MNDYLQQYLHVPYEFRNLELFHAIFDTAAVDI